MIDERRLTRWRHSTPSGIALKVLRRLMGVLLAALLLAGCESEPGIESSRQADSAASRPPSSELSADSSRATTARVQTVGQTAFVPGTEVAAIAADPSIDAWQSEMFAEHVRHQLDALLQSLPGHAAAPSAAKNRSLVADSFHCGPLRPATLEAVFESDGMIVRRMQGAPSETAFSDLFACLKQMLVGVESPRGVHSKVKVVHVDQGAAGAETTDFNRSLSEIRVWGTCQRGRFQINATWQSVWERAVSLPPRLAKLTVLNYEEVLTDSLKFADCTESILANTSFREQLLPGVDHWLERIDRRLGIDINGWQGLAIADVNGDGLDDVYCCQPGGLPNRLFLQQANGTCIDHSAASGLDWLDFSHAALFVDLDNDGDQDSVVGLDDGVLMLANDGHGRFSVRAQKILPAALPYSLTAADYDADGDLDIFVCCYNRRTGINQHIVFARPVPYHDANNGGRNVLLRNDITPDGTGDWQFHYVTRQVGLDQNNRRFSFAAAWEDYDDDGDLDLYVANDFGRNNLYRNDAGRFNDVARQAEVEDVGAGMSVCWGDYDNDGLIDLYVSNMFSSAGNRISFQDRFQATADPTTRAEFQRHARGNSLFKNAGDGTFHDVSQDAKVVLGRWAWGSRFADVNGDGWQDLIVANGFITQQDSGDL